MKKTIDYNRLHKQEYTTPQMDVYEITSSQALLAGSLRQSIPTDSSDDIEFD